MKSKTRLPRHSGRKEKQREGEEMSRWHDTRLKQPSSSGFDRYFVMFTSSGLHDMEPLFGIGSWLPKDGYTDGDWSKIESTTGVNHTDGETFVLYWCEHPDTPELKP